MQQGSLAQVDLLAACVLRVTEDDPAFLTHGLESGVYGRGRSQPLYGHDIAYRQTQTVFRCFGNQHQDALFKRVQAGQARQGMQRIGELQKTHINISRSGGSFHNKIFIPLRAATTASFLEISSGYYCFYSDQAKQKTTLLYGPSDWNEFWRLSCT